MNFSFSDVKTSIDKSAFFDKNLMVLYTEAGGCQLNNMNILERISQEEEDEDNETTVFKKPCIDQNQIDNVQYESQEDDY